MHRQEILNKILDFLRDKGMFQINFNYHLNYKAEEFLVRSEHFIIVFNEGPEAIYLSSFQLSTNMLRGIYMDLFNNTKDLF